MPLRYLLDTNVISHAAGPRRNPGIIDGMRRHWQTIATASVVWCELLYGMQRLPHSTRRSVIETYLRDFIADTIPILSYDPLAAEWHAAERVRLSNMGVVPPFQDGQIAAVAAVNGLVVVTANVDDFKHFSGLEVENWRT